jgi:hypothetical protein
MSDFKKKIIHEVHSQLLQHKKNILICIDRLFEDYENEIYKIVSNDY